MAQQNSGTECRQTLRGGARLQIGAAHGITQVDQHFGNPAHAGATDTDEMQMMDLVFHAASSSQIVATVCAASARASARAATACSHNAVRV